MEYRNVGKSGLVVSEIGVGCNQLGGRVDAAGARQIVETALSLGVTFFDTADIYFQGRSEEYLGAAVKPHRHDVVIATKSRLKTREGPYGAGASRKYLMDALDDCLRRLQTDYIDLYQMHTWDPATPVEETLRTLDDMVRRGKVRYIGSDLYTAAQIVESEWVARSNNLERFVSCIATYNMLERQPEQEIIPVCERYGIGFLPVYPLAQGFLTGKYRRGEPLPEDWRLASSPSAHRVLTERNFAILSDLQNFCAKSGRSMLEVAVGWLLSRESVPSVIAGVTSPDQIRANVEAGQNPLAPDELARVEQILNQSQVP